MFVLSDFIDMREDGQGTAYEDALKIAARKHDIAGIRIYDQREAELPNVGIVELKDAESGRKIWVDTSSAKIRDNYHEDWTKRESAIIETLQRCKVDTVSIATGEDYVKSLIKLFKKR